MNEFFNDERFMLVKVKFSESDGKRYTYASPKKFNLVKGDLVVVPVGDTKLNVVNGFSVAAVTSVTDNLSHIPKDFELKSVVQKINMAKYRSIIKAKSKYK